MPFSLAVQRIEQKFLESAPTQFTDAQSFSFSYALMRAFGLNFFSLGLLCFFGDCFKFVSPIMLHFLIKNFENSEKNVMQAYFC